MTSVPQTDRKSGIYAITNTANNRIYVGSSISIANRWKAHQRELDAGIHINGGLQQEWLQYGADAFTFTVLELCPRFDQLHLIETRYIAEYGDRVYNIAQPQPIRAGKREKKKQKQPVVAPVVVDAAPPRLTPTEQSIRRNLLTEQQDTVWQRARSKYNRNEAMTKEEYQSLYVRYPEIANREPKDWPIRPVKQESPAMSWLFFALWCAFFGVSIGIGVFLLYAHVI